MTRRIPPFRAFRLPRWASSPLLALALLLAMGACGGGISLLPSEDAPAPPPTAPDSFRVLFETTEGRFVVEAYREWSPAGVDRLWDLVRRGYYDDTPVFRVVEGYVAQFGIHGDSAVYREWTERGIPDEEVRVPNERGTVSFARSGPRSRTTQLFVNLADNTPRLDTLDYNGVSGFPPIGRVVEGMDAVDAFEDRYGNDVRQDSIVARGREYLDRAHPGLAWIVEARIVDDG